MMFGIRNHIFERSLTEILIKENGGGYRKRDIVNYTSSGQRFSFDAWRHLFFSSNERYRAAKEKPRPLYDMRVNIASPRSLKSQKRL